MNFPSFRHSERSEESPLGCFWRPFAALRVTSSPIIGRQGAGMKEPFIGNPPGQSGKDVRISKAANASKISRPEDRHLISLERLKFFIEVLDYH
jgi:hypothetical protein